MADENIMEEVLAAETDVISGKGHAFTDIRFDGCENIAEGSLGKHAASQVSENHNGDEAMNGQQVINIHGDQTGCDDKKYNAGLDMDDKVVSMDGRAPQVGMVFRSYEEAVSFYKLYALRVGFGVAVKKSSFTPYGLCRRLVLVCTKGGKGRENVCYQSRPTAKTDCLAMIVLKLWGDGLLHLMEAHIEHNHPTSPSAARFLKCYKKMSGRMTKDMVVRAGGHESISLDGKESMSFMDGGRLKLGQGDNEAIHQFFARMQAKNPNFFYLMDLDIEGHLRNVLWADARARAAYQYFGDVISFDTSYLKYKFDIPLVLFVGTNHHGQSILLGCGLVSEQIVENYTWLLKTWLTCMLGSAPIAVITDESKVIKDALSEVFPKARHRICLWKMLKSVKEKLKEYTEYKTIKRALNKVVIDSSQVDEFEENWSKLTKEFGLEDDDLLSSLYEHRNLWVPAFLKDTFWAGMSIVHYKERVNLFFDGYLYPQTCLKDFLSKYEVALHSKYEIEAQADYESFYKARILVSKYHMEEQLSKLYTLSIFKMFQNELKGVLYCKVLLIKVDASISTFKVKDCPFIDEIEKSQSKDYDVLYNIDGFQVHCSCGFFQFRGILCRHALSVFKLQQVYGIPARYIIDRWRKDYKQLNMLSRKSKDSLNINAMERYDNLSMRCLNLVDIGVMSDEKYQLALKLIREVEKSLLDDNLFRDLQRRFLPFDNRLSESDENHASHDYVIYETNKNSPSLPVKRRGRPPKKVKETSLEALPSSSNRKENVGTLMLDNPNSMFQAASNASQMGALIRMSGGVNLMEEVNPNQLSFGSHYGIHANPPDIIVHHSALQSANALQNQFGQQSIGNQQGVQWFYQQFFQEDQSLFGRRPG